VYQVGFSLHDFLPYILFTDNDDCENPFTYSYSLHISVRLSRL